MRVPFGTSLRVALEVCGVSDPSSEVLLGDSMTGLLLDSIDIPIILYNVPGRTGCSISPACCARLARHPNIAGIKEASGNISYTAKVAKLINKEFWVLIYRGTGHATPHFTLNSPYRSVHHQPL